MTTSPSPDHIPDPEAVPENAAAVVLDDVRYPLDQLSDAARGNIASIKFCDEAIQQRRNELAVADTARMAYASALKREMGKGDTNDSADAPG